MANHLITGYEFDWPGYFDWLKEKAGLGPKYSLLMSEMFKMEFTYKLIDDENRYKDGLSLINKYCEEANECYPETDILECSVLEMLVAFCERIHNEVYEDLSTQEWFREFIHNLYLDDQTDENFDLVYVKARIETWLQRDFSRNGTGNIMNLFCKGDVRMYPFWSQVQQYVIQKYGVPTFF